MTTVTLSSGSANPWVLPGDFPAGGTADTIECIGAGAGGCCHFFETGGPVGGGGGAYAKTANAILIGPQVFQAGTGGLGELTSRAATSGTGSWFGGAASAVAMVAAAGGKRRVGSAVASLTGGPGAKTISCIGAVVFAGGNGGPCISGIASGSGGGGAGTAGAAGTNGLTGTLAVSPGGTGGGSTGGAGGLTTAAAAGSNGGLYGGGGGGNSGGGTLPTVSTTVKMCIGGNGGVGGGGGGGGSGGNALQNLFVQFGGNGGKGIILVSYTPAAAGTAMVASLNLLGVGT